jgi:uncharacterized protein
VTLGRLYRSGWVRLLLALGVLGLALLIYGLWLAQSRPVERHVSIQAPNWPAGTPPLRLVLATDLHVSNLERSKGRIIRVIAQINALKPDLILLGGDFVGGDVQADARKVPGALDPLAQLKAKLGVFAVLGNHDHAAKDETDAIRRALHRARIRVLSNAAASAGPFVIGGIDDQFTHHARLNPTEASMIRRSGVMMLLAHSPDVFPLERLPITLTLAGHTHCGQIALPFYGAIIVPTHFGRRYACGLYHEDGRWMVVSGGIGTSQVPIRLFAPPDLWVIEMGPVKP